MDKFQEKKTAPWLASSLACGLALFACNDSAGTLSTSPYGDATARGGTSGAGSSDGGGIHLETGGNVSLSSGGSAPSDGGFSQDGGTLSSGGSPATASGGVSAVGCPRACGPTYEQFFDDTKVATLRVTFPRNVPQYSESGHCKPFSWTPVKVSYESEDGIGDEALENVGFRFRGSRAQPVQGFKLDMQVLDTPSAAGKRRFADLNRVNILSNEDDHTHLIQCAGYKALRDFGVPAPRCNLMKVYLNGNYYGLLENVEQVNRGFLRRHFGTNEGSLYGASLSNDGGTLSGGTCSGGMEDSKAKLAYSDDVFESYANQYQLTSATAADAEQNLIPMLKCGAVTSDADFKSCIADWLDVGEWLKVIAFESVLPELQSFIGFSRNYYLYFKPDPTSLYQGRFVVWPWDLDTSMDQNKCSPSSCDLLTSVDSLYRGSRPKLVTRLTSVFRQEYCAALNAFVSNVYKPALVSGLAALAEPSMANDPIDSSAAWQTAVSNLTDYITTRAGAARTSIDALCK